MDSLFSVKDRIALITGASSGIGKHFAVTLAKAGAHLILVGRNTTRLQETEQACRAFGVQVHGISADVQHVDEIHRMVAESKNVFPKIDILVHVAGIVMRAPVLELTEEQWDQVLDINTKGTFFMLQNIAQWMIETHTAGTLINISSIAAFHLTAIRAAYSASKIAVESLTRSFALSLLPHAIRVNCISPGAFITSINEAHLATSAGQAELASIPMKRAGQLSELDGALLLLASDASSYMTGSILQVDGGFAIGKI